MGQLEELESKVENLEKELQEERAKPPVPPANTVSDSVK